MIRNCKSCKIDKPLVDFPSYKSPKGRVGKRYKCRECFNAGVMEWFNNNPDAKHRVYVLRNYNISWEDYQSLMSSGCAVCGSFDRLCVDHDHSCCPSTAKSCGKCIRGALCNYCNLSEGFMKGNVENIRKLADYVENAKCGELS